MSAWRGRTLASLLTAAVVGGVLTLVNQWGAVRDGLFDRGFAGRAAINFAVPFLVSLYSRWSTGRNRG